MIYASFRYVLDDHNREAVMINIDTSLSSLQDQS